MTESAGNVGNVGSNAKTSMVVEHIKKCLEDGTYTRFECNGVALGVCDVDEVQQRKKAYKIWSDLLVRAQDASFDVDPHWRFFSGFEKWLSTTKSKGVGGAGIEPVFADFYGPDTCVVLPPAIRERWLDIRREIKNSHPSLVNKKQKWWVHLDGYAHGPFLFKKEAKAKWFELQNDWLIDNKAAITRAHKDLYKRFRDFIPEVEVKGNKWSAGLSKSGVLFKLGLSEDNRIKLDVPEIKNDDLKKQKVVNVLKESVLFSNEMIYKTLFYNILFPEREIKYSSILSKENKRTNFGDRNFKQMGSLAFTTYMNDRLNGFKARCQITNQFVFSDFEICRFTSHVAKCLNGSQDPLFDIDISTIKLDPSFIIPADDISTEERKHRYLMSLAKKGYTSSRDLFNYLYSGKWNNIVSDPDAEDILVIEDGQDGQDGQDSGGEMEVIDPVDEYNDDNDDHDPNY